MSNIGGIDAVARLGALTGAKAAGAAEGVSGTGFGAAMQEALDKVNTVQQDADTLAREIQAGNPEVSLEETMIALSKANIAFQTVVQTRNKLVSAYHDIMNMQI